MPKFHLEPTETFEAGEGFRRLDRRMHKALDEELDELKLLALEDLDTEAPEATGILKKGIKARKQINGRPGFDITIHARDPKSGFDYAAVTRFGHRVETIRSTRDYVFDARGRHVPAKLKVTFHKFEKTSKHRHKSNPVWLTQVKGVKTHRDWASDALFNIDGYLDYSSKRLSAKLDVRVFTGGA